MKNWRTRCAICWGAHVPGNHKNLTVMSDVASEYALAGVALIAVSVVGDLLLGDEALCE